MQIQKESICYKLSNCGECYEIGKAGFLPSISENFSFYRQLAVNQFEKKQYQSAGASLKELNGCLGEDYLVTISTTLYEQAIKDMTAYQCNYCTMIIKKTINKGEENEYVKEEQVPTEILTSRVRVFDLILSTMESVIRSKKYAKKWTCPECFELNDMDYTDKIVPQKVNPYFLKVVWDEPILQSGIANRLGFHELFQRWFNRFLEEINWQEVLYRTEYKRVNGFDMESGFKDKGDQ